MPETNDIYELETQAIVASAESPETTTEASRSDIVIVLDSNKFYPNKGCSCGMCRRGKSLGFGKSIKRDTQRKFRKTGKNSHLTRQINKDGEIFFLQFCNGSTDY